MCVQDHDHLTVCFLSSFFFFDWVEVLWPQLSKVLKLGRWARRVLFPSVSLQKQVVFYSFSVSCYLGTNASDSGESLSSYFSDLFCCWGRG